MYASKQKFDWKLCVKRTNANQLKVRQGLPPGCSICRTFMQFPQRLASPSQCASFIGQRKRRRPFPFNFHLSHCSRYNNWQLDLPVASAAVYTSTKQCLNICGWPCKPYKWGCFRHACTRLSSSVLFWNHNMKTWKPMARRQIGRKNEKITK
jgi:hypothetical protein